MYGDQGWYSWGPELYLDRLTEIYLWSMNRADLERLPKTEWIGFLEGADPGYPEKALRAAFEHIRKQMEDVRRDPTTPDTRLADWALDLNPVETNTLTNLTMGGYFARGRIWTLHARLRYFDPVKRRSGLPEDVGALVEKLTVESATVTLVNINQTQSRVVTVQAGGYAEHQFTAVRALGKETALNNLFFTVRLGPGAGARLK